jgi:hypothetical protein
VNLLELGPYKPSYTRRSTTHATSNTAVSLEPEPVTVPHVIASPTCKYIVAQLPVEGATGEAMVADRMADGPKLVPDGHATSTFNVHAPVFFVRQTKYPVVR